MNPKNMEKMMKQLNMDLKQIEAEEVIIKKKTGKTVIKNPEIMITNMAGRDIYQITGDIQESSISEDDIKMVMDQTGADKKTVSKKLEELNNDLAQAIIDLKSKE